MPTFINKGHGIIALSVVFFCLATYAMVLSAFLPRTNIPLLDILADDTHYKYFAILLIPTSAYFVIANWVGWQYYQNS
ncbi:hypothetical protein FA15DRAFT_580647 [Coprinopsis marcescibilis]|uniref:Uncharacterized protein n=1 Tax=Coprinopsis marcescibilis TaxID=230819 RepID=A0A5C3LAT2_COPMA|nr:hypothetical protein FA15DRAFT_580647 [Coprinopsis marcescibilis]